MNEVNEKSCSCTNCPGEGCNCGCMQEATASTCACCTPCQCGENCSCAEA